ncbi:MAG: hypothetical protein K6G60_10270 [Lachnospiraceae bacterium]|nr:hypothetical protein [Lachnospiraceae bacterium]
MPEQLKNIQKKALEYWNKWTTKQKTIIIGIFAGVVLIITALILFLGRTRYTALYNFGSTETASRAVTTLKEAGYASKLDSDGTTVLVDRDYYVEAVTTVYNADIGDDDFDINKLLDNSLTTTNDERLTKKFLRSESEIKKNIMMIEGITDASINYIPKDTTNSVIAANQSVPAAVKISYNSRFDKKKVAGIAAIVAKGLGNKNTDDITIVDHKGEVLFDGSNPDVDTLDISDKHAMINRLQKEYSDLVTGALIMNGFAEVEVNSYPDINWDQVSKRVEEYLPLNGEDRGVLYEYHERSSENKSQDGDVPGTDSNDEVDYYIAPGSSGNSETFQQDSYYKPSVSITETLYDSGTITDKTTIAVTARRVIKRTKSDLELLGELNDDMTYERYTLEHREPVLTETPDALVKIVSYATGIDEDRVTLITYDVYQFVDDQARDIDVTLVVQIALAVLLLLILLVVIFRGMRPVEITEVEPELSIEQLLATTKENQSLEDVEFSEESETRKMIEKFFDENPEAVAALLRNWLNEDWM